MNIINISSLSQKTPAELQAEVIKLYSSMTPERFSEHTNNLQLLAEKRGQENEREEIVCRLLASDMSVEEVAVVLCVKTDAVRMIQQNNAATKIPQYAKKLKERRRRREK